MPEQQGVLRFSVDARHVRQLGRELVSDSATAVAELIKNAYDADATRVKVIFSDSARARSGGALSVSDNGSGMTLSDIRDRWMVISTAHKDANSVSSRFGRVRAGQKGIGRFATESLGHRLTLRSTVTGAPEQIVVEFDWHDNYEAGLDLADVANHFRVEEAPVDASGTVLEIEGLHQSWPESALSRVRNAVFLLQPPFRLADSAPLFLDPEAEESSASSGPGSEGGDDSDPGFRVSVRYASSSSQSNAPDGLAGILSSATAAIQLSIDEDGEVRRTLHSPHLEISRSDVLPEPVLLTGPMAMEAAYFIWRRDALNPSGNLALRRAQALAERFGGIRLYRDGLRIPPYGDKGDDWLTLDLLSRQRSQVLAPVGNNNFFGEVLLSRSENPLLVDTASREGVVENEAFEDLRKAVRDTLVWAVGEVAAVRLKKGKAGKTAPKPPTPTRGDVLAPIAAQAKVVADATGYKDRDRALADLLSLVNSSVAAASQGDADDEAKAQDLLDEIALLRVLASLGSSMAVFSHEAAAVLSQAVGAVGDLVEEMETTTDDSPLAEALVVAERNLNALADLGSYLDVVVSQGGRRDRSPQALDMVLRQFKSSFEPLLSRRGVTLTSSVDPLHLRTVEMSRSEIDAVLFNFLSNALKALDVESLPHRQIDISAYAEDGRVLLRFSDTGGGVRETVRDRVFDAFVTTSGAQDGELGIGTGLGLKIVRDIVEANGGTIDLSVADAPYVTCFEARIPQWTSQQENSDE